MKLTLSRKAYDLLDTRNEKIEIILQNEIGRSLCEHFGKQLGKMKDKIDLIERDKNGNLIVDLQLFIEGEEAEPMILAYLIKKMDFLIEEEANQLAQRKFNNFMHSFKNKIHKDFETFLLEEEDLSKEEEA